MKLFIYLVFMAALAGCTASGGAVTQQAPAATQYMCLPCGSGCDTAVYNNPGTCSHCNMMLVNRQTIIQQSVNPAALCGHIQKAGAGNVLLLDVRTPEEFNGTAAEKFGRLKNAVNIPVQQLAQRMDELKQYQNREIIVYCSHSHRSPRASYMLTQNGFKRVTNLNGGMSVFMQQAGADTCSQNIYMAQ